MPTPPDEVADDLKRRIGEAIRSVRGEMKQAPLADLLGVDQSTFSGWESGRYMAPLHLLPAIEEACGVRRGAILRRVDLVEDSIEAAIASDPALDDRGRNAVASYYRFVRDEFSGEWSDA
jgi:transcriptional regulator with XRE-family HTH domain